MVNILITGDRKYNNEELIKETLKNLYESDAIFIHGGATGADTLGAKIATTLGYKVVICKAEWDKYGRAAGPIRNLKMIQLLEPTHDIIIAFHEDLKNSKGTKNCLVTALKNKIENIYLNGEKVTHDEIVEKMILN